VSGELETRLRELMLLALEGNSSAYEEFLGKTAAFVRSFLTLSSGSRFSTSERIDDVVQEVLVSIHRKRDLYKADMPILPWIRAIAKYRFIDQLRSEKRCPNQVEWDEAVENEVSVPAPSHGVDSGDELLEGLTDRQKEILRLAKVEDMPLAEIAKRQGMSLSAVKVTIHRSVQAIRKNFGREK
jgi:RNA polymerase sigma-70 factor (ECF subfamily)